MVILALVKTPFPGISEGHHSMTRRGFREMWSRGGDGGSVLRGLSFKRINIIGLRDVGKKKKKAFHCTGDIGDLQGIYYGPVSRRF